MRRSSSSSQLQFLGPLAAAGRLSGWGWRAGGLAWRDVGESARVLGRGEWGVGREGVGPPIPWRCWVGAGYGVAPPDRGALLLILVVRGARGERCVRVCMCMGVHAWSGCSGNMRFRANQLIRAATLTGRPGMMTRHAKGQRRRRPAAQPTRGHRGGQQTQHPTPHAVAVARKPPPPRSTHHLLVRWACLHTDPPSTTVFGRSLPAVLKHTGRAPIPPQQTPVALHSAGSVTRSRSIPSPFLLAPPASRPSRRDAKARR